MVGIENKVRNIFTMPGTIVDKSLNNLSDNFKKLPRFVSDYLISILVNTNNPSEGVVKINDLINNHYIESNQKELIKSRIKEIGQYNLIGHIKCRYDNNKEEYFVDVEALEEKNARISYDILKQHNEALLTTGAWGTITICYDQSFKIKNTTYPLLITNFIPFQVTRINLDDWIRKSQEFSLEEWIDLIISTIGFDPSSLSRDEKFIYIIRLIPFVESNINMIELGPPETGKTFAYRSLSSYGFVISGSMTTVASLFYNKLRRQTGIIVNRDVVMFDEITNANFSKNDEIISILKDYLNTGKFSRDNREFSSESSIMFAGNIICNREDKTVRNTYRHLFLPLPETIRNDRAFLDRIHGFIPGWIAPQIKSENISKSIGFMADYFSEIMHRLRSRNYGYIISSKIKFENIGQRNEVAVTRMASGLLKLMFPSKTVKNINEEELKLVLDIAISLRKRVLEQLAIISPSEFNNVDINYKIL